MRFMVIVKATKDSEAGKMPSEELLSAMAKFNEEMVKAGVMLDGNGLQPSRPLWLHRPVIVLFPVAEWVTRGAFGDSFGQVDRFKRGCSTIQRPPVGIALKPGGRSVAPVLFPKAVGQNASRVAPRLKLPEATQPC
jgi:hypothetical protein